MVSCVTNPHLSSCIKAAVTIALVAATGGEGEVEVAAMNAAEEGSADIAEQVGAKAAESCGLSFTPGTKVLLASGKAVPISSLKPGEKVLATNTRTGKTQAGTIAAVLVHHDTNRYDLTIRARGRTAVIHTTSNHPFWDATTGRWVKAGALRYGTHLRTPAGGTATVLGGHAPRNRSGWMWDLTIPGNHDFYIATTAADVLVHNCSVRMTQQQADTLSVGPHAGEPVPATGPVVTPEQSEAMQGLPCHTCGETAPRMIGDHQVATGLNPTGQAQDLYSQCSVCSADQSRAVLRGQQILRNHGIYNPNAPGAYARLMQILSDHIG